MKNVIFIGGINGSGKTTIAKGLSKKMRISYFDSSKMLMRELKLKEDDYYNLRRLSEKQKKKALLEVFQKTSLANKGKIIMTGHFVKVLNGKITRYKGSWFKFCSDIIHILSKPELINQRIVDDENSGSRKRIIFRKSQNKDLNFISNALNKSFVSFQEITEKYKVNAFSVNNDGSLESIIKDICEKINTRI